ncbi:hypothetical protein EV426DRAFT_601444 [Tirmania nivea]|nr:hypothetical protein EV426DRAFT_601444 [Tirmania nivea]
MDYRSDLASGGGPPLAIQEIAAKAIDFEYNPMIPLRYWLRTADTMLKEANIYEREGNEQQTYMLLLRHAELLLKYLPDHPDASLPENKKNLRIMREHLREDVKRLEYLKPRILARYEAYEKVLREREARRQTLGATRSSALPGSQQQYVAYSPRSSFSSNKQVPKPMDLLQSGPRSASPGPMSPPLGRDTPGDTQQVVLELARQEFARREKEKLTRGNSTRSSKWSGREVERIAAPTSPVTESVADRYSQLRQQYAPYPGSRDSERHRHSGEYDLLKHMHALNIRANELHGEYERRASSSRGSEKNRSDRDSGGGGTGRGWVYEYPAVPKQSTRSPPSPAPLPQFPLSLTAGISSDYLKYDNRAPPPLPPLPDSVLNGNNSGLPPVPRKTPLPPPSPPPLVPPPLAPPSLPSLPNLPVTLINPTPPPPPKLPTEITGPQPLKRSGTTSNYEFKTSARLENGQRLRTIFLPANLRHKFLDIAYPNTKRNLETCGVLCGTLIQNALFITRLVVPEQEVTSDTCDMKDEEELFKYVDGEDLMVLGWIHTHPMYECFMSSVDLHNHCGYQLMLPESIAVVCAPRYEPSWGVFRLTDPPGVKTIMTCTQKSLFHPHEAGEELYTDAMRPGHVVVVNEMEFEVIDLRK